jgi:hypothetical protein
MQRQSKRLNRHLQTAQGEKASAGILDAVPFFCLLPEIAQLAALPPEPTAKKRLCVVLPQTCRHAAAARVRAACGMQVFLLLGKATRAPEGGGKQPCRLGEQDVARLGRPVRAGWRG